MSAVTAPSAPGTAAQAPAAGRKRKLGMAVDLDRCLGCWACAIACKEENNIPLGLWWNRVLTAGGGDDDAEKPEGLGMVLEGPLTEGAGDPLQMGYLPLSCQHCEDPPCAKVCPTGATYKREQDGIVLVDYDQCIGCRYCMAACPYGVRVFNWGKARRVPDFDYGEVAPRPAGVVEKCTFCVHLVDRGELPACVAACPGQARIFGDLNDPDSEVSRAIVARGGFRLLEDKNTRPQVFYLSSRRRRVL